MRFTGVILTPNKNEKKNPQSNTHIYIYITVQQELINLYVDFYQFHGLIFIIN